MSREEEVAYRQKKLHDLREKGIDPYPARVRRTHTIATALGTFDALAEGGKTIVLVGRLRAKRKHGGLLFAHLEDGSGNMQLALKKDTLGTESFIFFEEHFDIGDFVEVEGTLFKTKLGERTLLVSRYAMASKALLPLPEKWHGLTDTEIRYRKRYLDLIMNQDVRTRMRVRSELLTALRVFMDAEGFLEVETPTLQPIYGGGFARPFVTHHNALDRDFYLRISDEMYLKRLLVGGIERVYEITKVFRNEGIDRDHTPEFTMFEAQAAYQDYRWGMDFFESIVQHLAKHVLKTTDLEYDGTTLQFARPWKRMRVVEAVRDIAKLDTEAWKTVDEAKTVVAKKITDREKKQALERLGTLGEVVTFAFEELVESKLIQPTIIYDYPVEVSPLAKRAEDPRYVERFEAFVWGSEIGNNYSELNDPLELEKRFVEEKRKEAAGFDEAHQTDHDYLEAIQYGMPPACGLGIGIDRLVMFLTGAKTIKEVILFPTQRPEEESGV